MKKIEINLLVVFVILLTSSAVHAGDIQDGFMDTKWGAGIASLEGFSKLYSKNDVDFYANPQKVYQVKDFTVADIVYGFYTNKFFAVYINIESLEVFSEIKKYMKSKYGIPKITFSTKSGERVERWKKGNAKIKLKYREKTGKMKLAFYYIPLSTEINEAQQEKYHESAVRFLPIEKDKRPKAMPLLTF